MTMMVGTNESDDNADDYMMMTTVTTTATTMMMTMLLIKKVENEEGEDKDVETYTSPKTMDIPWIEPGPARG